MEEENREGSLVVQRVVAIAQTSTFWIGFFATCYLAVLPMADTIALRNVALVSLLLCLTWHFRKSCPSLQWPLPLILWVIYLIVFPFIADSTATAFESLQGQWGRGVLAMLAGAGVGAIFSKRNKSTAFYLGVVSAVPILVHLCLFIWRTWTTSSIPWGYWGRETHHADLGYAAGQSVVLLVASIVASQKKTMRPLAMAFIIACFLSTALAHSRAGLVFCLIGSLFVVIAFSATSAKLRRKQIFFSLAGVVVLGTLVLTVAVKNDIRWSNMTSELVAGFYGDAVELQCRGTAAIESEITAKYSDQSQRLISSVQYGDGSRIAVLRAGVALALKNPWGGDGSRQAFQKLLRHECANPVISMAHTHNGWLDTVLALGWCGALLYLWVLLFFMKQGLLLLRHVSGVNEWALVLVALSAFWIMRGFTDSVFRDHMLEMQGFVLAFAFVASRRQIKFH
jgi:hypothetical protein